MTTRGLANTAIYPWIALSLALLGQLVEALAMNGVPVLYPFIQESFALTRAQIGLITSSLAAGGLLTALLGGWLTDAIGVKRVMLVTLVCTALFMTAFTAASTFAVLLVLAAFLGAAIAPAYPATPRIIIDWIPERFRALSMSFKQAGFTLGGALAAAILPTLAILLGWRNAAAATGASVFIILVIYLMFYRDISRSSASTGKPNLATLSIFARNRSLMVTVIWGGIFAGLQHTIVGYFMLFLIEKLAISAVMAGGLLAIAQGSSVAARILWGAASDFVFKRRRIPILVIIGFLTAISLFGVSLLQLGAPRATQLILAVLIGVSTLGFHGVFTILVGELAGPRQAGMAVGVAATSFRFGMIIFPPLFGK